MLVFLLGGALSEQFFCRKSAQISLFSSKVGYLQVVCFLVVFFVVNLVDVRLPPGQPAEWLREPGGYPFGTQFA